MEGTQRERGQVVGTELGLVGMGQAIQVQVSRLSLLVLILTSMEAIKGY